MYASCKKSSEVKMERLWQLVVLVVFASCSASAEDAPPRVIYHHHKLFFNTTYPVLHMEVDAHRTKQESILFSTIKGLKTTNGHTTHILVSNMSVVSFTQINSHHVVFADREAHCIKILSRITGSVETLAGTCGSQGNRDGGIGEGLLRYPYGVVSNIKKPGFLLVTDEGNHALRNIDLFTGEMSTVVHTNIDTPRGTVWDGNNLLVVNYYYHISIVSWSDGAAKTHTLTGDAGRPGDILGKFNAARFRTLFGAVKLRDRVFIVTDYGNKKLKFIDLDKKAVGPVCFKKEDEDSDRISCDSPEEPVSALLAGRSLYLGSKTGIFKMSASESLTEPVIAGECPNDNVTVSLEAGQASAKVDLPNMGEVDLPEGVHKMTKDDNSKPCTYYVTVKAKSGLVEKALLGECPKNITVSLMEGQTTTKVKLPGGHEVEYPAGVFTLTKNYGPRKCTYHVIVQAKSGLVGKALLGECPKNITVSLMEGQTTTKVKLPGGHEVEYPAGVFTLTKNYGPRKCTYYVIVQEDSKLAEKATLTDCPNNVTAILPTGQQTVKIKLPNDHEVEFPVGVFSMTKNISSRLCTYYITVTNIDGTDHEQCPFQNITTLLTPGEYVVKVEWSTGKSELLPEGVHRKTTEHNSKTCYYDHIVKKSPIVRRLYFKSEYDATCDLLKKASFLDNLKRSLARRRDHIQEACGTDCTMSLTRDPVYECKDDLLKVHWAADHFYSVDTKEPSKPVLDNVKEKLNNSYIMKTLGFFVPFHQPPMIEAKQDTKGDYVQVFLHSSCTIRSQNYNAVTDTCA